MNLLTNLYYQISNLYKYISRQAYIQNIILYIVKSSLHIHELVHEQIIMFGFDLFNNWV